MVEVPTIFNRIYKNRLELGVFYVIYGVHNDGPRK